MKSKQRKYRKVRPVGPAEFLRRNVLNMTASELAVELGVTQGCVSKYVIFPKAHRERIQAIVRGYGEFIMEHHWTEFPISPGKKK